MLLLKEVCILNNPIIIYLSKDYKDVTVKIDKKDDILITSYTCNHKEIDDDIVDMVKAFNSEYPDIPYETYCFMHSNNEYSRVSMCCNSIETPASRITGFEVVWK